MQLLLLADSRRASRSGWSIVCHLAHSRSLSPHLYSLFQFRT